MPSNTKDSALSQHDNLASSQQQEDFFANLSRFQNDVLNHRHPRYKLPSAEVQNLASSLQSNAPISSVPHTAPRAINGDQVQPVESEASFSTLQQPRATVSRSRTSQSKPAPKAVHERLSSSSSAAAAAAVDPASSTKSNDLARAKFRVERLRIEKTLKESLEIAKKAESTRAKSAKESPLLFAPLHIDVTQVLEASKSLVKPFSGLQTPNIDEVSPVNSSFDENSYYSSKGNSWSSSVEEAQAANVKSFSFQQHHAHVDYPKNGPVSTVREPRVSGLGPQNDTNSSATIREPASSQFEPQPALPNPTPSAIPQRPTEQSDMLREESYSPPEATDDYEPPPPEHFIAISTEQDPAALGQTEQALRNQRARDSESYSPPPAPEQALRGQLPAEQPHSSQPDTISSAMISDLQQVLANGQSTQSVKQPTTQTKLTRAEKKRIKSQNKAKNPQTQPNDAARRLSGNHAPSSSRKRRREAEESDDNSNQLSGRRPTFPFNNHRSASPDTYVKPEPSSPPPPSNEPPRRLVFHPDGRAHIEVFPPSHPVSDRATGAGNVDANRSARRVPQYDPRYSASDPIVLDDSDAPPPTTGRRRMQQEGGLRRFASLQHASHSYTPGHPSPNYNIDELYSAQSAPQVELDRPRYQVREDEPNRQVPLYHRAYDKRTAPFVYPDRQTISPMPPPPPPQPPRLALGRAPRQRIVVDEYGNKYIAVPAPQDAHELASREMDEESPHYLGRQLYDQNFQTASRTPEIRGRMHPHPPVIQIDDDDDDYEDDGVANYQPMAPPRMIIPRKRTVESRDDAALMQPPQYPYYSSNRAASLQPNASLGNDARQYAPYQPDAWPAQNMGVPRRERAFSARPSFAATDDYYHPSSGSPSWRRMQ